MTLSEMRRVLTERGIQLTKSLGQNFLHDGNQLRRIVDAANLQPGDKVLEIGPGLGPLTELLLARGAEVLAIEKDRRLVDFLSQHFNVAPVSRLPAPRVANDRAGEAPAFLLHHDDALEFLRREQRDWSDWKVVANLPYAITSPLLVELAQAPLGPQRLSVTLQLEAAQRLTAGPGAKDYGLLTLLVQVRYEPMGLFKIPASCFFPEPDVDSAGVTLVRRPEPLLSVRQTVVFTKVVKRAFGQRRKMMLKLLRQDWPAPALASAFEQLHLSPQCRAEDVSLETFVGLIRLLTQPTEPAPTT